MNKMESTHFESLYPDTTRFDEISKLLEHVKAGKSSELVSLAGSGRSNTLGLLSYNRAVRLKHLDENQKWFHFVWMDFSEVKKRSLFDVTKFILISLVYSLSERGMTIEYEKVNGFLKEGLKFQDELILFQTLKKVIDFLSIEKELTVVLLCDRFEQYTPDVTEQFFINLKVLRNRAKYRFSVIFALPRPLEDLLDSNIYAEFYEFLGGNTVFLHPKDTTGLTFRMSYLEKVSGKKADEKIKNEIIELTGGIGKLVRLAYESVLSYNEPVKNLQAFLLDKTTIQNALLDIYNQLNPSEQNVLQNLIKNHNGKEENIAALQFLEKIGLIKSVSSHWRISLPLLENMIKKMPHEESKLYFDSQKNEIFKNNQSITEILSPSEFRLLRFLLQNVGRILEKSEIIESVWKNSKTQEGVTDQALDQIIYRLRKKIEDDPNNPKYIETVKGRGLKFTQ